MDFKGQISPLVIEKINGIERAYDVYSRLLKDRIIFLGSQVTAELANDVVAQLLFLENDDPTKPITIYINSPGGSVPAGFAIYDTMQYIKPDVSTIVAGLAASMGGIILAAGEKGKRYALPNAQIMIHEISISEMGGKATDIENTADYIKKINDRMIKTLANLTGQSAEKVAQDIKKDFFLNPEEAKAYGLIDEIIKKNK